MGAADWHLWQVAITALGGMITIALGVGTFIWQRMQMRTWLSNERFQSDSHTLNLCQTLSDPSPQLRLAAAALLFERLNHLSRSSASERERSAIIQALLAATIADSSTAPKGFASAELCKYIADSVKKVLLADRSDRGKSPLEPFYWQKVQFKGAYWADVDARRVDFFGASFDNASLRNANLEGAVFYEASLVGARLSGANLKGCDFRGADLRGADLRDDDRSVATQGPKRTEWSGIKLAGAKYDAATRFPPDMDPASLGMQCCDDDGSRKQP